MATHTNWTWNAKELGAYGDGVTDDQPALQLPGDASGARADDRRDVESADGAGDAVRAAKPGVVVAIPVGVGTEVRLGDPLAVLEAMKMEHVVRAEQAAIRALRPSGWNLRQGQGSERSDSPASL